MGGVSSRDHSITAAEDRRPGAYHRAKDLDPLCQGLPLEERLCLGLDGSALLKNPKPKTPPFVAKQKAAVRLKLSNKANPDWLPDRKPMSKTGNEENEPTRRPIDNQATPREKGGLTPHLLPASLPTRVRNMME